MSSLPVSLGGGDATLGRLVRRTWRLWLALHAFALLAVAAALLMVAEIPPWPWLAPASLVAAWQLILLRRGLPDNRGPGELLRANLGAGTAVTLIRGLLLACVAGFIATPIEDGWQLVLPGGLYLTAALADRLDGALARATGHVTRLGARLDVELDALGLVVAPLYGVIVGRLPPWYLVLGAAYYLFAVGVALRRAWSLPVFENRLRPSAHSRVFAGFQMAVVGVALLPVLPTWLTWWAASLFMVPVGVGFWRDWLVLCGRLDPTSSAYRRGIRRLIGWTRGLAPVTLRMALLVAGLWLLTDVHGVSRWLALVFLLPVILGLLPRAASLGLVLLLGTLTPGPSVVITAIAALVILTLGGGRWCAWPAEERWLFHRPR